jgi:GMP synthase (glutamine-hydrolysing)
MSRLRLALLNASQGESTAHTSRNFRRELAADLVEFVVSDGRLPPGDDYDYDYDGVVVTGSAAAAYRDEPWIEGSREWVADAHRRGLPILGVCFGHQLLASALGGRVEPMCEDRAADGGFELGYREVERIGDGPLLAGLGDRFTVFTSHGDRVADLPPRAEPIAHNDYGLHGFRLGHAFGVQFHPEYDVETAEHVAAGKEASLGAERVAGVLDGITEERYAAACESKRLFDNFTDYAHRVRADDADPGTGVAGN